MGDTGLRRVVPAWRQHVATIKATTGPDVSVRGKLSRSLIHVILYLFLTSQP